MNNRLIYDYLYSKGLTPERIGDLIPKLSKKKIYKYTEELTEKVEIDSTKASSNFDLIANSSLSGESGQCSALGCRIKNFEHLARKSSLYANKVWIKAPFQDYSSYRKYNFDKDSLQETFHDDISMLHKYKSMFEAGLFSFAHTEIHFCLNCFNRTSKKVISKSLVNNIKKAKKHLIERFRKGADYHLHNDLEDEDELSLKILSKDSDLFEHEALYYFFDKLPEEFELAKSRKNGKIYQKELIKSRQLSRFVNPILKDIILQDWYSSNFNANYLTNRPIDLEVIQSLNGNNTAQNSDLFYNSLSHTLPIIENIKIEKLIELRQKEPEAFINYRNSLDSLLNKSKGMSKKEIEEAFKDEIQPRLDQMNQTIKGNRRKIVKNSIHALVTGASMVGIGLFSGIFPPGVGQSLAALGVFHHGSKLTTELSNILNQSDVNTKDKYYFLWKLKN